MEDEASGREANKLCGVCGDRALGYNFNAVSCESCKAFFRRNALKNKDFRCPFTENCEITVVTRRFCQKCRLDKCFSIGMRKEYIMSEEDKVLKRQKIEQNRAKKRLQQEFPKTSKLKRESLDETNYDHETASVPSVASEIYVWEADKKYTDLDENREQTTDSLSPVAAASVPSPSSSPEGANISGSKTLEMLHNRNPAHTIANDDQHSSNFEASQLSFTGRIHEHNRYIVSPPSAMDCSYPTSTIYGSPTSRPSTVEETTPRSRNLNPVSSKIASRHDLTAFDHNPSCSPHPDQLPKTQCHYDQTLSSTTTELSARPMSLLDNRHHSTSEMDSNQKPVMARDVSESQASQNLFMKFSKALSNPEIVFKLIQDQAFIAKIMTDTDTVSRLIADPQISKLLEENDVSSTNEGIEATVDLGSQPALKQNLLKDSISDTMIKQIFEAEQKHVANPILTNLITNQTSTQCKHPTSEPDASDYRQKSNMEDVTRDILQDVQRIPIAANSIESILCEAIKLEFSACSGLGGNTNSRELNDAERAKLNELIVANKALLAPLDDDITNLVGEDCRFKGTAGQSDPMLLDVINLTAIAIRRLIKMSKKINAFKNMCQEDQLALLKGGCTEMMILRAASNYDSDRDIWKIPHSQERMSKIKVDVLKEAKGNLYSEHSRFVKTFDPRWRDENIILILSAIALFTPDRPRVIHNDVIKLEQNSYYYLLRRYLESVYPGCEAKSTFLKLIQKISELHKLNDEVVGVYLNVNPSSVEPLLIEIFDLKH